MKKIKIRRLKAHSAKSSLTQVNQYVRVVQSGQLKSPQRKIIKSAVQIKRLTPVQRVQRLVPVEPVVPATNFQPLIPVMQLQPVAPIYPILPYTASNANIYPRKTYPHQTPQSTQSPFPSPVPSPSPTPSPTPSATDNEFDDLNNETQSHAESIQAEEVREDLNDRSIDDNKVTKITEYLNPVKRIAKRKKRFCITNNPYVCCAFLASLLMWLLLLAFSATIAILYFSQQIQGKIKRKKNLMLIK
jgi:hypothetical protein